MKKIVILAFIMLFFSPSHASANGAGLPAFFKINGKYSQSNPLQNYGITSQSFLLPQDFAPENYLVNQSITFEIDQTQLGTTIPPDLLKNTTYIWDYGDGSSKETGLTHTHTYTKIGSYILILTINLAGDPSQQPTQFIDSYLLNILPSKDYQGLPHAVIKIDGTEVNGAQSFAPVNLSFHYPVLFDASSSKSTMPITQYLWDFGDGQTGTQPTMQHSYKLDSKMVYSTDVVVLRVKDKNGFINDSYIAVNNDPKLKNTPNIQNNAAVKQNIFSNLKRTLNLLLIVGLFAIIAFLLVKRIRKP